MAGRDHNAAVEVIDTSDISYRRGSGNMEQIGICAGGGQASNQAVLKHIA